MTSAPEVIIVHETVHQALLRDAGTFGTIISLIGFGLVLDSQAMQWVGAALGSIVIFGRARGSAHRVSIPKARELLDRIERGDL